MIEFLLELLGSLVLWVIFWLLALPLWLLIVTPYVLVAAVFDSQSYGQAVRTRYRAAWNGFADFWERIGWTFP